MAIKRKEPAPEPRSRLLVMVALLALAVCAAHVVGGGWRGCLRVDAGQRMQMVVEAPPANPEGRDSAGEGDWEGRMEAAGVRVRWQLTAIANRDK